MIPLLLGREIDTVDCETFLKSAEFERISERVIECINGLVFRNLVLFETKAGRFGRSCAHIQSGDKVYILYGGRLPFILRSAESAFVSTQHDRDGMIQTHQLIGGETYVQELADGEGLRIAEIGGLQVQDFYLR